MKDIYRFVVHPRKGGDAIIQIDQAPNMEIEQLGFLIFFSEFSQHRLSKALPFPHLEQGLGFATPVLVPKRYKGAVV